MDRRQFLFGLAALAVAAPVVAEAVPVIPRTRYAPPGVYNGVVFRGIAVVDGVQVEIGDNIVVSNQRDDGDNGIYVVKAVVGEHDLHLATIEATGVKMGRTPMKTKPVEPARAKSRHTWPAPRRRTTAIRGSS